MWFVSIHSIFSAQMIRKIRGCWCLPSTSERFRIGGTAFATKTHSASILDFLYALRVNWIIWLKTWVNYYIYPHLKVIIAVIGPEVPSSFTQRCYWTLYWSQYNSSYIVTHTDYEIHFNIILSFRSNIIRRQLWIVNFLSIRRPEISRYFSLGIKYSP